MQRGEILDNVSLYFEDVKEGDEVPVFQRTTDTMHFNRFAAVNDEYGYIHMDDAFARERGQKGVFAMGHLRFCYLHNMLRAWIGDSGSIRRVTCQYRGIQYKGDTVSCRGRVVRKYSDKTEHFVELEVWVENQNGDVLSPGQAIVVLPSRGQVQRLIYPNTVGQPG